MRKGIIGLVLLSAAVLILLLLQVLDSDSSRDSQAVTISEAAPTDSIESQNGIGNSNDLEILSYPAPEGMVDVRIGCPALLVELAYAREDNFIGKAVYKEIKLERAFLQEDIAKKLCKAAEILESRNPELRLLIYDAFRPSAVQHKMWEVVKGTGLERYVAIPKPGSLHNLGVSVDVSLCYTDGSLLDMGTEFDHLGEMAEPRHHQRLLAEGKLSRVQIDNRNLLKQIMKEAGFLPILTEWWHFNGMSKEEARRLYPNPID